MVCVWRPLQSPLQIPLGGNMFISRHDMPLTFTCCDPRVFFLIGNDHSYLIGQTVYQFHNSAHAHKCIECHSILIRNGSGISLYYSFLGRTGSKTTAIIISDAQGQPYFIVCSNYIISKQAEEHSYLMELQQMGKSFSQRPVPATDLTGKDVIDLSPLHQVTSPVSCTESEHDDTGYNSAVSNGGSASSSPCPLGSATGTGESGVSTIYTSKHQLPFDQYQLADKGGGHVLTEPSLGFHSTLSPAIYGDELSIQDITVSVPSPTRTYPAKGMMEDFELPPTPSLSNQQSDPLLCSNIIGQRLGQGSVSYDMENMGLLEDLLERIADCDNSQDSAFTNSPPHCMMRETVITTKTETSSISQLQNTLNLDMAVSQLALKVHSKPLQDPSLLVKSFGSSQPTSLLRTLLNKEDNTLNDCVPVTESQAKLSSGIGQVSSSSSGRSDKSQACISTASNVKTRQLPTAVVSQWVNDLHSSKKQLIICGGKQVLVPREVDLIQEISGGESEEEDNECTLDSESLPPALPEDLLDFAMQYCDSISGLDTDLPDGMTSLDSDVWSSVVEDLVSPDSQVTTLLSSASDSVNSTSKTPVVDISIGTLKKPSYQKHCDKRLRQEISDSDQPPVLTLSLSQSVSSPVIQSAIISSTLKDKEPEVTASIKPTPALGLKSQRKDKVAIVLKCTSAANKNVIKCIQLVTPALSDHRYSSLSNNQPPCGKRMRTDYDKDSGSEERRLSSGHSSLPSAARPGSSPKTVSQTTYTEGKGHKQVDVSSLSDKVQNWSNENSRKSLPASPIPIPIPANGGGKPLNAMSELEKHLRGLVAPPDERHNESDDILNPVECAQSGSKPFLERLLTGEISHERYRQIDYHLLYQERERRLSKKGQSS